MNARDAIVRDWLLDQLVFANERPLRPGETPEARRQYEKVCYRQIVALEEGSPLAQTHDVHQETRSE